MSDEAYRAEIEATIQRLGVERAAYALWYGEAAIARIIFGLDDEVIGRLEDIERHMPWPMSLPPSRTP